MLEMRFLLPLVALVLSMSGLGLLVAGEPLGFVLILVAGAPVYRIVRLQQEPRREETALVEGPPEVTGRHVELEADAKRLADQVLSTKSKLDLAADHYAPSCLQPIEGLDAGAGQALDQARSLIASGASPDDDDRRAEAPESLRRATELVGRIEDHLSKLERAALTAPALVEQAELAIDRAWAGDRSSGEVDAGRDQIVARAQELAKEARTQLGVAQPDWFHVSSLAKRALEMVSDLAPVGQANNVLAPSGAGVESARQAAETALAEVVVLVNSVEQRAGASNMAALCLERGHSAYSEGVELQRQIAGAEDPDAITDSAVESFRLAVTAANAAEEHAFQLQGGGGRLSGSAWSKLGTMSKISG
jgi:antitoxin (DNA-binding transcriptional repressor) of toxin-antitoxin stability system